MCWDGASSPLQLIQIITCLVIIEMVRIKSGSDEKKMSLVKWKKELFFALWLLPWCEEGTYPETYLGPYISRACVTSMALTTARAFLPFPPCLRLFPDPSTSPVRLLSSPPVLNTGPASLDTLFLSPCLIYSSPQSYFTSKLPSRPTIAQLPRTSWPPKPPLPRRMLHKSS